MKKIGIIGGEAGTGRQFAGALEKLGFDVLVTGEKTADKNGVLVKNCDILIIAVPLHVVEDVLFEVAELVDNPGQIIVDFSSVKAITMPILKKIEAQIVPVHPLFGNYHQSLENRQIIMCADNSEMEQIFEKLGLNILKMNVDEHDQVMARVQVLPHVLLSVFAQLKNNEDIFNTHLCDQLESLHHKMRKQNSSLYAGILLKNPLSLKIIDEAIDDLFKLRKLLLKGDFEGLKGRF